MKSQKTLKQLMAGIALTALSFSLLSVSALTVSPARQELTADPGETISDSFLVINEQEGEQTFYTSVEAFEAQGESGTPNFIVSKEGLPSWVKVDEKITLKKGERLKINYSITVPSDAEAGGHFAGIFLSTVPPTAGEGQVSVGAKVGVLVLLKVTGQVKEEGGLLSFVTKNGKNMFTSIPIEFLYRFSNGGSDRVKPEGNITITNMFGSKMAELNANPSSGNVLPSSVRRFEVKYGDKEAPSVSAPFKEHVKFEWNNFSFGIYTATLDLKFGEKGVASQSISLYMFPWHLLVVISVISIVFILVLIFMLKRYNQWIINQAKQASK